LRRNIREKRKKSEKRSGGQKGHAGRTLVPVAEADRVIEHRPHRCENCQHPLQDVAGEVKERRQIPDLPELRLEVEEHHVVKGRCPSCQRSMRGQFPANVRAAVQSGPRVQALAISLSQFQWLPMERVCETLSDLCNCQLSEGTLVTWIEQVVHRREPTQERIKTLLLQSDLIHADETGVRIKGLLHWVHVAATTTLTHYRWHRRRGQEAMTALEIWPN